MWRPDWRVFLCFFCSGGQFRLKRHRASRLWRSLRETALLLFCLMLVSAGCRPAASPAPAPPSPLEELGKLPGLRRTKEQALKAELSRIEEERGTPEQMTLPLPAPEDNVAAIFHELFPAERLPFLLAKSDEWLTAEPQTLAEDRDALRDFLRPWESQRKLVRKALHRPRCVFPIAFTAGFGADLRWVNQVILAVDMELLAALLHLEDGQSDEALGCVEIALEITHRLSQGRHPVVRFEATRLRRKGLDVLQTILLKGEASRESVSRLADGLDRQLATWPSDAETWKAFRALGLHAYELVRIGRLFDILTEQETHRLRRDHDLESLVVTARESADADELYFLLQMREVIKLAEQPFFRWKGELERLQAAWQSQADDERFLVSCGVLLPMIPEGQTTQAEEAANVTAWWVALRAALGQKDASQRVNPLTGENYWLESQGDWMYVSGIGTDLGRQGAIAVRAFKPLQ